MTNKTIFKCIQNRKSTAPPTKGPLESRFIYLLSTGIQVLLCYTVTHQVSQCPSFRTSVCSDLSPSHLHSPSSGSPLWSLTCPLVWVSSPLLPPLFFPDSSQLVDQWRPRLLRAPNFQSSKIKKVLWKTPKYISKLVKSTSWWQI